MSELAIPGLNKPINWAAKERKMVAYQLYPSALRSRRRWGRQAEAEEVDDVPNTPTRLFRKEDLEDSGKAQEEDSGDGSPASFAKKRETEKIAFPCALETGPVAPLVVLRELAMEQLMNAITDKPNWHEKVFDDEIADKWKAEFVNTAVREVDPPERHDADLDDRDEEAEYELSKEENEGMAVPGQVSEKMADWIIEELRDLAKGMFKQTGIAPAVHRGVVKSDTAVPEELRLELLQNTAPLENIPNDDKDWHPGSDGQVLDLVHPSLYPLVYGESKVLKTGEVPLDKTLETAGEGEVLKAELKELPEEEHGTYSEFYQWLPCTVELSKEKNRGCKITSYINNLHPIRNKALYQTIERIIDCAIPLWGYCLPHAAPENYQMSPARMYWGQVHRNKELEDYYDAMGEGYEEDEDYEAEEEKQEAWQEENCALIQPEVSRKGYISKIWGRHPYEKLEKNFSKLQVIVKLANIELTPEKHTYLGGTWHVEGQLNEHIAASAIYYYSSENIKSSRLAFRHSAMVPDFMQIEYMQNDHQWMQEIWGTVNDGIPVQQLGSVDTRQGRLIAFPNVLQHRVQPFELDDKTRPGSRKILALFLVDPSMTVIGTDRVPPQRRDWWDEAIQKTYGRMLGVSEIHNTIVSNVDYPWSRQKANDIREKLMAERSSFKDAQMEKVIGDETFNLCEH